VVNLWGQQDREIRIELNRPLAEAAGVNIFQLAQTLTKANFNLASAATSGTRGQVRAPLAGDLPDGGAARGHDRRGRRTCGCGHRPRSSTTTPESERVDRYNGRPSMVMFVLKESQANTVEVCERIKRGGR
jgi:HAE1 family hydrophobic/amphiphilic exporter-1